MKSARTEPTRSKTPPSSAFTSEPRSKPFPQSRHFHRIYRTERALRALRGALWVGLVGAVGAGGFLLAREPSPGGLLVAVGLVGTVWAVAMGIVAHAFFRKIENGRVALRADRRLGLPDDLLALSEFPSGPDAARWREAAWERARRAVEAGGGAWSPRLSRPDRGLLAAALAATLLVGFLGSRQFVRISAEQTARAGERDRREKAAEPTLADWEEFAKSTDQPELKELFARAANLREALASDDPMEAMLEMNRIEARLDALQLALAASSMAPHAAKIAEAFEAIEGGGAMAAALRNENFQAAADEAAKLSASLPEHGSSAMRRAESLADMMAREADSAARRGNSALSQTLSRTSQMAGTHAPSARVPNPDLKACSGEMAGHLKSEAARQACNRAAATGKSQLDALRACLRGEPNPSAPSLCKKPGNQPGGLNAGKGSDGNPPGDPTMPSDPADALHVAGSAGEGESEITESRAASGNAGGTSGETTAAAADYFELSRKAVADESLPLAHRHAIRTYFERIRPLTQSQ